MKKWITGSIGVVLMLSLVGCGASASTTNNTSTGHGTTGGNSKKLTFAMSGLYPPFNYHGKDGKLTGFDVAIGDAIAKQMGVTPDPVTNPWKTIIPALNADKFQAIIGSMADTKSREKVVNFSIPYYKSGAQIFVRKGNTTIHGPQDLRGKVIGVVASSTYAKLARKLTDASKVKTYDSDVYALHDLEIPGRLDAVITDKLVGEYAIKHGGLKVQPVGKPLSLDNMAVAVRKDEPGLLKKINAALKAIESNGTYAAISNKYFGENLLTDPNLKSSSSH